MISRSFQKSLFSLENEAFFVSIPSMSSSKAQQDEWSGKIGVILAVAGSAVGLGNFLRFPGLAAQYGGGAFMVAYGLMLVLVGVPVAWAEWSIGRPTTCMPTIFPCGMSCPITTGPASVAPTFCWTMANPASNGLGSSPAWIIITAASADIRQHLFPVQGNG